MRKTCFNVFIILMILIISNVPVISEKEVATNEKPREVDLTEDALNPSIW